MKRKLFGLVLFLSIGMLVGSEILFRSLMLEIVNNTDKEATFSSVSVKPNYFIRDSGVLLLSNNALPAHSILGQVKIRIRPFTSLIYSINGHQNERKFSVSCEADVTSLSDGMLWSKVILIMRDSNVTCGK